MKKKKKKKKCFDSYWGRGESSHIQRRVYACMMSVTSSSSSSSFSTRFALTALWGLPRRGSHYFLESLYTPGRWLAWRWRPVTSGNWTPNIYIPSGARVAQLYPHVLGAHFSRLLRHAWTTLALFFTPGHHTGVMSVTRQHFLTSQHVKHFRLFPL
jgi:hypothetical protein